MKRWGGALAVVVLACLTIIFLHARGPVPLRDLDTWHILTAIRQRGNALSWFGTDWPLQNGFYRPITVLSLQLDIALFPATTEGYGLSAAIYCALCVLALFWLARELTDSPLAAAAAALLFALWNTPIEIHWDWISWALALALLVVGVARHKGNVGKYLPAALALAFLATELRGVHLHEAPSGFYAGVLRWIPSRTATVMTFFCLCSLAAYARFVRLSSGKVQQGASSIDLPATRTTTDSVSKRTSSIGWLIASMICALLALGSYEQAVMLPAVLLTTGAMMHFQGFRQNWRLHLIYWILLVAYIGLHRGAVPVTLSTYANQQLRSGLTAYLSIFNYVAPCTAYAAAWYSQLPLGSAVLLIGLFYSFPLQVAGNAVAYIASFRDSKIILFAWQSSVAAFLPMAFLKPFSHYHYWAMSIRAIFVVLLAGAISKLVSTAVSLPTIQAPLRPSPAPGSLRRQ